MLCVTGEVTGSTSVVPPRANVVCAVTGLARSQLQPKAFRDFVNEVNLRVGSLDIINGTATLKSHGSLVKCRDEPTPLIDSLCVPYIFAWCEPCRYDVSAAWPSTTVCFVIARRPPRGRPTGNVPRVRPVMRPIPLRGKLSQTRHF